jgi:hypothetical protein
LDKEYKRVCLDIWGCIPTDVAWAKGTDLYINRLEWEYEQASEEQSKRFDELPIDRFLDYKEINDFMREVNTKVAIKSRAYRLVKKPIFSELSTFGDVMKLDEFIECCEDGSFIDYDGFGRYVKNNMESDIDIYPSDVKHKSIRTDFDTIIWFNR